MSVGMPIWRPAKLRGRNAVQSSGAAPRMPKVIPLAGFSFHFLHAARRIFRLVRASIGSAGSMSEGCSGTGSHFAKSIHSMTLDMGRSLMPSWRSMLRHWARWCMAWVVTWVRMPPTVKV